MFPAIAPGIFASYSATGGEIEYEDTFVDLTIGTNTSGGVTIYGFNSIISTIGGAVPYGDVSPDSFLGQDFYSFLVLDRSGVSGPNTLELTFVGTLAQNFFDQIIVPGVGTFNTNSLSYYGTDYPAATVGTIWDWELTGPYDLTVGDTITVTLRNII